MRTKPFAIAAVTLVGIIFLSVSSSYAGAKQRHRWEGFAMGLGAAVIGQHILSHGNYGPVTQAYAYPAPLPTVQYYETHVYNHELRYCPQPRHHHRPTKIVHNHYHGKRHHGYAKHNRRQRPVKEIHNHYYGRGSKHHRAKYHYDD
ncbi:MAG: hypothetical protein WBG37_15195 [Desulfobacterales bacterium]